MSTAQEMAEFVLLWGLLEHVQLSEEPDQITWKWNAKGVYTTKSTYAIQFRGILLYFCSEHDLIFHLFELILVIHANTSNETNHII
jgi:hypothetical protein